MKKFLRSSVIGAISLASTTLSGGAASAQPLLWTITGGTFDDGGTFSGSFVYDADTNTYSSINIATIAGAVRTQGATMTTTSGTNQTASFVALRTTTGDNTGLSGMFLRFNRPLTNTGGSASIDVIAAGGRTLEGTCGNPACQGLLVAGSRNATAAAPAMAIPTMSEWAMILMALALAGFASMALVKKRRLA